MLSHKAERIYNQVFPENIGFSNRFLLKTLTIGILLCAIATVFNVSIGLSPLLSAYTFLCTLVLSAMYYLARFNKYYTQVRYSFVYFVLVSLNVLWFLNGGSSGPTLFVFQAVFALGLFIIPPRLFKAACVVFAINLTALFFMEYKFPHLIFGYPTDLDRLLDIYLIIVIFFLFEIPLIFYANHNYKLEQLKAQRSDRIKSAFLANMSHEIRTPMNVILGFSELLRDQDIKNEERNQYLDIIQKNGTQLLNLLGNVLDLSKLESNLMSQHRRNVHLLSFLEHMQESFEFQASQKGNVLSIHPDSYQNDVVVLTDETFLTQIFSNLISNAIKFTETGSITIGHAIHDNKITFFVRDTGIGIDKEYLPFIFERFRQGDERLKREYNGTGLGLAITKGLVDLLGGKIWVRTSKGEGAIFSFSIDADFTRVKKEKRQYNPALN